MTTRTTRSTILFAFWFLLALTFPHQIFSASLRQVTLAHWGHEKVFIYLPLYVAIDEGYFRAQNLDVKLLYAGNDDQVFASVLSGNAQFGVADPVFAAISREKGGSGKVIANLVNRVSNWGVGRSSKTPLIDDVRKLDGLRVSSFPAPSTAYSVLADIKSRYGLRNMKIVELAPGTEIAAMTHGDVDIALTGEPAVSLAESQGFPVVLSLADYYGPFAFSGITTTDEVLASHPDLARSLVRGLQAALQEIHSSPQRVVEVAAANFPNLSKQVIEAAVKRMVRGGSIPDDVKIDPQAWRRALELRASIGDLHDATSVAALDNEFADAETVAGIAKPSKQTEAKAVVGDRFLFWLSLLANIVTLAGIPAIFIQAKRNMSARKVLSFLQGRSTVARELLVCFKNTTSRPLASIEAELRGRLPSIDPERITEDLTDLRARYLTGSDESLSLRRRQASRRSDLQRDLDDFNLS